MNHREPGDNYTPEQEDWVAGRLPYQKQAALRAKKVRSYIAAHPGASDREIRDNFGKNTMLMWLLKRGLIKPFYNESAQVGWEVVPL